MDRQSLPEFFLPDFCRVQSILIVVVIGELLAVIFTLLNLDAGIDGWGVFGLYSISLQWISLGSVAVLCLLRPSLAQLNDVAAGMISLLIILVVTFIYSLLSLFFYLGVDLGSSLSSQILIRNLVIAGLIGSVLLRYFYLQQQYVKQLGLESVARLEALQARIRPHFLFNSMNVIASLIRIDPSRAETAIEDLSDLIRATLDNKNELIPLKTELENGKKYLSIEGLRLGERLRVSWDISENCLTVMVPPLSVQPMLENAIHHGIQTIPEGGEIVVSAKKKGGVLTIQVINPKSDVVKRRGMHKGQGIALDNIDQRLEVIFGSSAHLQREESAKEYKIAMIIPIRPIIGVESGH